MHTRYHRVIVKIGTSTLTNGTPGLSKPKLVEIVRQLSELKASGIEVVLVTSGGIAAGREIIPSSEIPKHLPGKQMLAAIGQPRLMAIYTQLFALYDQKIAQVLLTREDLSDRRRYLNARGTLEALLSMGVIPIINENDTVATEEIRFGDNDRLSALVANVLEADLLVLLTDQDGVYTADPRANPEAKLITQVDTPEIPSALMNGAEDSTTGLGTGGMITKLNAADLARRSGAEVMIVNGNADNILHRVVVDHEAAGTFFTSLISHMESRKRYLLSGMQGAVGALRIDRGAVDALRSGGSLLPVGIRQVVGGFTRGDTCKIQDQDGNDIAVGLCAYTSEEVERLIGLRSDQIESQLGYTYGAEVIHRDNMVLL